jgi:hypothetical protein
VSLDPTARTQSQAPQEGPAAKIHKLRALVVASGSLAAMSKSKFPRQEEVSKEGDKEMGMGRERAMCTCLLRSFGVESSQRFLEAFFPHERFFGKYRELRSRYGGGKGFIEVLFVPVPTLSFCVLLFRSYPIF